MTRRIALLVFCCSMSLSLMSLAQETQCRAFGAAAIMRMPTRLHIAWQDDNMLKIETDAARGKRVAQAPA